MQNKVRRYIAMIMGLIALVLAILAVTIPADASPEYTYTVNVLFQWASAPSLVIALLAWPDKTAGGAGRGLSICISLALLAAMGPLCLKATSWQISIALSVCWGMLFLFVALSTFIFAARHRNGTLQSLGSLVGSILLAFACMECFLLCSGKVISSEIIENNAQSHYVKDGVSCHFKCNEPVSERGTGRAGGMAKWQEKLCRL